jgi:glycosyltransferase involved in cell wall biosynthesis
MPLPLNADGARVAFVLWSGQLGGAEVLTAEVAARLRRQRVDARVVFVSSGEPLVRRLTELHVPYRTLSLGRGRHVIRNPRKIARLVAAEGGTCAVLVSSGYLAASLRLGGYEQPIAAVEHGGLLQVDQLPLPRRLVRRIDRLSGLWACDVEVAVSSYMLEALRRRQHARQLICIRNGIDLRRFSPSPRADDTDGVFTVGYGGRLIAGKGVADVIRAFASMKTIDSQLLIAGDGPERHALEHLASTLNVKPRMRFLGRVDDMPSFWRRCDVGVAPSAGWIESFCLSAVEAMACGCPVVASRTGALPEIVRDGVTGVLVDQGDASAFVEALDRYARDTSLLVQHGREARALCETEYDLDRTADGYLKLIGSLATLGAGARHRQLRRPRNGSFSHNGS